jgi:hypothetical protein
VARHAFLLPMICVVACTADKPQPIVANNSSPAANYPVACHEPGSWASAAQCEFPGRDTNRDLEFHPPIETGDRRNHPKIYAYTNQKTGESQFVIAEMGLRPETQKKIIGLGAKRVYKGKTGEWVYVLPRPRIKHRINEVTGEEESVVIEAGLTDGMKEHFARRGERVQDPNIGEWVYVLPPPRIPIRILTRSTGDSGCAPMPFGGSMFGPWDTGQPPEFRP